MHGNPDLDQIRIDSTFFLFNLIRLNIFIYLITFTFNYLTKLKYNLVHAIKCFIICIEKFSSIYIPQITFCEGFNLT